MPFNFSSDENSNQNSNEMFPLLPLLAENTNTRPLQTINWAKIRDVETYVQDGYLDYTLTRLHPVVRYSIFALVMGLFVGYSYLNFRVCKIFWILARRGANLLPGSIAINEATAPPSAFGINFLLNQFFAINAYKLLFNSIAYQVVHEKFHQDETRSLNWSRAKLVASLFSIFTLAIFASMVMVALGDTALRSTQLDIYSGIVFFVQNLLGGLELKTWLLDIPTNLKGIHSTFSAYKGYAFGYLAEQARLFCQQSYYLATANKSAETPKNLLPKDTRSEVEKLACAADKTKQDYFDPEDAAYYTDSFANHELSDQWKKNYDTIKSDSKLTWENSHSRACLILLIKLICQACTLWANVFLIWNGADFLQKIGIPSAFYLKWIVSGIIFSPFSKLSYDLVNSSVDGLYKLSETILQQLYAVLTGCRSPQQNPILPSNTTWKKVIYRCALGIASLAIIIGIFAAWQSSGTGIALTAQYGYMGWLLNILPNLLSHINFNTEGNNQLVLTLLGLLGNYLYSYSAPEKCENVSYCGYNGIGDTGMFKSKLDKLRDFVTREKFYEQEKSQSNSLIY